MGKLMDVFGARGLAVVARFMSVSFLWKKPRIDFWPFDPKLEEDFFSAGLGESAIVATTIIAGAFYAPEQ